MIFFSPPLYTKSVTSDNLKISQFEGLSGASEAPPHLIMKAAPGSRSVYFSTIVTATGDTYSQTDSLTFSFHFEYLD